MLKARCGAVTFGKPKPPAGSRHDTIVRDMRRGGPSERAAHLSLMGSNPAYRLGSVNLTLLSVCDDLLRSHGAAVAWTTTCHPTAARIWGRHFAARELDARAPDHAPLARELWRSIGVVPSVAHWRCLGCFPREYTESEVALIARTAKAFPGPCSMLDVVGGDRLLLLARP